METRERRPLGRRVARTVAETVAWVVVLVAVWVATLSTISGTELLFALGAALALTPVAMTARRALGVVVRPHRGWAAWLVRVPGAVAADSVRLVAAVLRVARRGGTIGADRELVLPAEDTPRARTRAALAALVVSSTPGSYVTDVEPASPDAPGTLTVHALGAEPSGLERAVTR